MTVFRQDSDSYSAIAVRRCVNGIPLQVYFGLRRAGKLVPLSEESEIEKTAISLDQRFASLQRKYELIRHNERAPSSRSTYPHSTDVRGITLRLKPQHRPRTTHFSPVFEQIIRAHSPTRFFE